VFGCGGLLVRAACRFADGVDAAACFGIARFFGAST
jgi:hypothetical protein